MATDTAARAPGAAVDPRELRIHDARYELASVEEIRELQLRKLKEMLYFVSATNTFYRRKWKEVGVDVEKIDSLDAFAALVPTVDKSDFIADQEGAPPFGTRLERGLSLRDRLEVYTTSGTSGQGVEVHAQTERELRQARDLYCFGLRWAGLRPGDGTLLTLPLTMMAGGRMELAGATAYGLTVYPCGSFSAAEKLGSIERFRPRALYGSTSYFGHLAALCDEPQEAGVDVLLTGLEGVGLAYILQLEQQWGAKAFDRFGATQVRTDWMFTCERGVGSVERPGMLHGLDPWVLLEVIDTDTGRQVKAGEQGELVVTSLFHWDTPVVRCSLRDLGVYQPPEYCDCGRPFAGIQVCSVGRTDDVKKIKGVNVFPEAVDNILYSMAEVDEYRVVLSAGPADTDVVTVSIMPRDDLAGEAREGFRHKVKRRLKEGVGISFEVELTNEIERSEYKARRWHDHRVRG